MASNVSAASAALARFRKCPDAAAVAGRGHIVYNNDTSRREKSCQPGGIAFGLKKKKRYSVRCFGVHSIKTKKIEQSCKNQQFELLATIFFPQKTQITSFMKND